MTKGHVPNATSGLAKAIAGSPNGVEQMRAIDQVIALLILHAVPLLILGIALWHLTY